MTTGTISTPLPTGFTDTVGFHPRFYKTWTGADGKSEAYAGGTRVKWNNYQATIASRQMLYPGFGFMATGSAAPPNDTWNRLQYIEYYPSWAPYFDATTFSANEQNTLLSKINKKVKGHKFNLAVNLGQMKQTVGMLSVNLSKLGKSIRALKHGDFSSAARQLGASPRTSKLKGSDVSGRWLELQYGWLPLLSDSFEAMKAFEAISDGPRVKLFRASISKPSPPFQHSQSPTHYSALSKGKAMRRIQYEMYEEMDASRQIGLLDPLSLVWELVPYSFVVDWFIPFGTYLDNLNQIPNLKGRWLSTDLWQKQGSTEVVWKGSLPNYYGGWYCRSLVRNLSGVESYTRLQRTFSGSPPVVPRPQFGFGGINSSRRFWNAVSLAYQRFAD